MNKLVFVGSWGTIFAMSVSPALRVYTPCHLCPFFFDTFTRFDGEIQIHSLKQWEKEYIKLFFSWVVKSTFQKCGGSYDNINR